MAKHKRSRTHSSERSLKIAEFCKLHAVSRSMYYVLRAEGLGPREMRIGRTIRITAEANRDWQQRMEAGSAPGSASRPKAIEKDGSEKENPYRGDRNSHSRSKRDKRSRRHSRDKRSKRHKNLTVHQGTKPHTGESSGSGA